ncbi:glycoside hydrolase family 88/105 protein [Lactiplantibacillus modestisalitolerans]|uniref:Glycoside hydrolase family 105 protein n=1 Tax=Lactiplantibacillus modestisalitolerans TaxID=1457219 RepID=A0ABV5WU24_9LACO|nr:glycoside hydrolase family 88 protein [Lactiplantibacillus modestisalitolerans]
MYRQYGDLQTDWPTKGAQTMLNREPEMNLKGKWEYEDGLMLNGMYAIYKTTHEKAYFDYIKHNIDEFIDDEGHIKSYHRDEWSLDFINNGKAVLDLYDETHDPKYKAVADRLYDQLLSQPRTDIDVFWHKQIYPNQIWLDGLYMGSVFYARYQKTFGITDHLEDVVHQFLGAYKATYDEKTGLCYHATDVSRKAFWCDPETGHSPHFWTRSIGWFVMAIVDVMEYLPADLDGREQMLSNLRDLLKALRKVADPKTGLWYQVTDEGDRPMNYLESSGSLMILNAIAKGLRMGYLDEAEWSDFLKNGFENALQQFISVDRHDYVNVNKIAHVGGLGGANKRDGSFAYYMSEPIVVNDHKGVGPFLLLANEMRQRLN